MELAAAHETLRTVRDDVDDAGWGRELTTAVQRALAELYLLSPHDDVDGAIGRRTRAAWRLFRDAQVPGPAQRIDPASAARLIAISGGRDDVIGRPAITLPPDFPFRRSRGAANREASAEAIVACARRAGMTRAQIAYVLATAQHESAGFATLEEFDPGDRYEGRADLGNDQPGDGPRFKGRGFVQITGRRNYTAYAARSGVRLTDYPVIPMNWPALSVWILVDGMERGAFTGRRLSEFISDRRQDFRNARRVVNGLDRADHIANLAEGWLLQLG